LQTYKQPGFTWKKLPFESQKVEVFPYKPY